MSSENADSSSNTRYCTNCGAEISVDTNYCPECGAEQGRQTIKEKSDTETLDEENQGLRHKFPGISENNTTRRNVLVGIIYSVFGLSVLGAIAGSDEPSNGGGSDGNANGGNPTTTQEQYPDAWTYDEDSGIVLRDVEANVGQFSVNITGVATNESGNDYSYVQLTFAIYDETDAKIGDALANTAGLDAEQRWRFEAVGTGAENADSFSLEDITAY